LTDGNAKLSQLWKTVMAENEKGEESRAMAWVPEDRELLH
jgi:hypothetical protein